MTMIRRLAIATLVAIPSVHALADVRLSNDFPGGGYISTYTLATGTAYSDATLAECGTSKSRLLSATVYITDIAAKPEMNRAWDEWVDRANPPQRACIGAALEGVDLVEIVAIAAL